MNPALFLAFGFAGLGLFVGYFVATVSARLNPQPGRGCVRQGGEALTTVRFPLLLLGCALIGAWAAVAQPTLAAAAMTALFGWQLLLIATVDGEHFWLPDRLTLPLLITGLATSVLLGTPHLFDAIIGVIAGFASLRLLAYCYRRARGRDGLGGGDPFLFGAIGAWVGWIGLPTVLVWASAAGLSLVVATRWSDRRLTGSSRLPFGVFLAIGSWLTWLYGPLGT